MNPTPMTPITTTPTPAPAAVTPKDKKTAQSFEAVFLGQMTQLMLESVEPGDFGGGHGEEMFRGVMAEQLGTAMSRCGGIGLAPHVLDQIIRLQGGTIHG